LAERKGAVGPKNDAPALGAGQVVRRDESERSKKLEEIEKRGGGVLEEGFAGSARGGLSSLSLQRRLGRLEPMSPMLLLQSR
jgi:hypothetical protein